MSLHSSGLQLHFARERHSRSRYIVTQLAMPSRLLNRLPKTSLHGFQKSGHTDMYERDARQSA